MPKIVDHAQRRAEIIDATLTLIAAEGVTAVTSRGLAKHLGISNGALWRYFDDKADLLAAAYRTVVTNTNKRAAAALEGAHGAEAVLAFVQALLPLTDIAGQEAKVVVGFWGLAAADRAASSLGRPELQEWDKQIEVLLHRARQAGEVRNETPVRALTTMLLSYVVNTQVEYVFQGPEITRNILQPVAEILQTFRTG